MSKTYHNKREKKAVLARRAADRHDKRGWVPLVVVTTHIYHRNRPPQKPKQPKPTPPRIIVLKEKAS